MKKLPNAEFDIMKAIWHSSTPIVGNDIVLKLNQDTTKIWSLQTVHKLLSRLEKRGFLTSEKKGKQRFFSAIIPEMEYLQFETQDFVKSYYSGSLLNLVNALYQDEDLKTEEIEELQEWLNQRRAKDE